jgi:hypothetical protein
MYCVHCGWDDLVDVGGGKMICRNCHKVVIVRTSQNSGNKNPHVNNEWDYEEVDNTWGTAQESQPYPYIYAGGHSPSRKKKGKMTNLQQAAFIFMIIACVVMGIYIIPLLWCIPMTVSFRRRIREGRPIGVGFKICTLLFLNTIAGILLLCDDDN